MPNFFDNYSKNINQYFVPVPKALVLSPLLLNSGMRSILKTIFPESSYLTLLILRLFVLLSIAYLFSFIYRLIFVNKDNQNIKRGFF